MSSAFNLKASEHLHNADGKRFFNREHFTESAPRYDVATIMLSFGQDRSWKRKLVSMIPMLDAPRCIDIACGTGDITFLLAEKFPDAEILGTDLTEAMLEIAAKKNTYQNVSFAARDMCSLEQPDTSVDLLTGGYAIRNAPDLRSALLEIHRVLRPGGLAAFLDFSKPTSKLSQKIQHGLLKFWGSCCGLLLHGNPEVHGYISSSLKNFPDREQLLHHFEEVGFSIQKRERVLFGMLELTLLEKLDNE